MATTKSLVLTATKGTIENVTFYQRNGKTVARIAKNSCGKQHRTLPQQIHRIRFANCIQLAKQVLMGSACCFPDRKTGSTEYNAFMHHNLPICKCYLTRELIQRPCCMPFDGLVLASGSLEPIGIGDMEEAGVLATTIALGTQPVDSSTRLCDAAKAIVENNMGVRFGDELVIVVCNLTDMDSPFATFDRCSLPMNGHGRTIAEETGISFLCSQPDGKGGYNLAFNTDAIPYCAGMAIYVRRDADKQVQCSRGTLRLLPCIDNRYCTREAFDLAIESYGGVDKRGYLDPVNDEDTILGEFAKEE